MYISNSFKFFVQASKGALGEARASRFTWPGAASVIAIASKKKRKYTEQAIGKDMINPFNYSTLVSKNSIMRPRPSSRSPRVSHMSNMPGCKRYIRGDLLRTHGVVDYCG